ncbi:MAG: response regulator [Ferruginibacter sp.]|uniref:response regulator n=1 Tax=Ferruginibacter sp. TaxID=1940288 RepID=UPI002657E3CA|nr:response regulator [Ferruginibacter sp.]MDB5280669.1 response regulator [Ferruginibacter sp.]
MVAIMKIKLKEKHFFYSNIFTFNPNLLEKMNKNGPIVIIEDDPDDQDFLQTVFSELNIPNRLILFSEAKAALEFFNASKEIFFLIISDINMPKMSGFELRDKVHSSDELRLRCIPYIFLSTSFDPQTIVDAYSRSIQGYFTKPNSYEDLKHQIATIVAYWSNAQLPQPL